MALFTVVFENSKRESRTIGKASTFRGSMDLIKKFCSERNFEIHYTRWWEEGEDTLTVDVGSHTECFHIKRKLSESDQQRIWYFKNEINCARAQRSRFKHKADFYAEKVLETDRRIESFEEIIKETGGW